MDECLKKLEQLQSDRKILVEALEGLSLFLTLKQLGDGYSAMVRQYPHKDMLPELTQVREVVPIDWEKVWIEADKLASEDPRHSARRLIQELVEKQLKGE